nr:MAG TPA: hypothetical protein [Caudoviricetes sp.]
MVGGIFVLIFRKLHRCKEVSGMATSTMNILIICVAVIILAKWC